MSLLAGNGQVASAQSKFPDVPSSAWGHKEIHLLKDKGVITGHSDGTFRPNNTLTRAHGAVIITGALGLNGLKVSNPTFPDVSLNHWASAEIERAVQQGIFTGRKDGKFYSAETMNKAQAAAIIARAFNLSGGASSSFTDISSQHWTLKEIVALEHNGIVEKGGRYEPGKAITRAEFSTYVARALDPSFRLNQSQPSNETVQFQGEVTVSSTLNVRLGAGTSFSVLGNLKGGQKVDVYATQGSWYKIKYVNGWGYVSSSYVKKVSNNSNNTPNSVLWDRIIAIDPGHGGKDPGAVANGLQEKDVVLGVGLELNKQLQSAGAKPVLTRNNDTFVELDQRAKIANDAKADIFVSIHANAAASTAGNGTETWISASSATKSESKDLAEKINKRLVQELGTTDRGVKEANFKVLVQTNMPGVLIELGFLTNSKDAALMKQSNYNSRAATAIRKGIEDYYSSK